MRTYKVVEVFGTVQGEGSRAGARSVFVRLGGCNAWNGRPEDRAKGRGACAAWCDTMFTGGQPMTAVEVLARAGRAWGPAGTPPWVVLSGGEPMLQLDGELLGAFHGAGWKVALETNGSVWSPLLQEVDHVCVSPKLGMDLKVLHGTELKVVLPGGRDQLGGGDGWTVEQLDDFAVLPFEHHYLQPQDPIDPARTEASCLHRNVDFHVQIGNLLGEKYDRNVAIVLGLVERDPRWRVSLQSHKMLGVR